MSDSTQPEMTDTPKTWRRVTIEVLLILFLIMGIVWFFALWLKLDSYAVKEKNKEIHELNIRIETLEMACRR